MSIFSSYIQLRGDGYSSSDLVLSIYLAQGRRILFSRSCIIHIFSSGETDTLLQILYYPYVQLRGDGYSSPDLVLSICLAYGRLILFYRSCIIHIFSLGETDTLLQILYYPYIQLREDGYSSPDLVLSIYLAQGRRIFFSRSCIIHLFSLGETDTLLQILYYPNIQFRGDRYSSPDLVLSIYLVQGRRILFSRSCIIYFAFFQDGYPGLCRIF